MGWDGWVEYGGVEVINTDRTEAYARNANVGWFRPVVNSGLLAQMLGDPEYASPLQDDAPWADPDLAASYDFYGAYPLEINGWEDSTMTAPVTESTGDGGVVGRMRRATRSVVFSLALVGRDERAVDYGLSWLKNVFSGGPCLGRSDQDCNVGMNLCFLTAPPCLDPCTPAYVPPPQTTTTLLRTNLSTNPSAEVSADGWSAGPGVGAPVRKLAQAASGSARLSASGTNTSTTPSLIQGVGPLAPGDVLSLSAKVRADSKELLKNGTLDSGVTSWSAAGGAALSRTGAARTGAGGVITWGTGHAANTEGINQTVTGLTVGKAYRLTGWLKNDTNGAKAKPHVRLATPLIGGTAVTTIGAWTLSTLTFTATATSHVIGVTNSALTAKGTTTIDDLSLIAVENIPTSASFKVLADNGTTVIANVPAPWAPDASGWQTVSGTITVPAGAAGIQFAPGLVTPANYTGELGVDQVLIEKSPTVDTYFDGDSGDTSLFTYNWASAAGLSVSEQHGVTAVVVGGDVAPPPAFDPQLCLAPLIRSLHRCSTTVGPTVTAKQTTTDGGCVWTVSITVVAGNPVVFGEERPLIKGFGDPKVAVPYIGGITPPGGAFDVNGFIETEVSCPVPTYQPVYDPLCPLVIPPPPVPSIQLSCFDFPVNYKRRQFTIPEPNVPLWTKVVPYFEIHTASHEVRSLRLRFYPDPDGDGTTLQDPCSFCGDIVFSYIPAGKTMVFDGADHLVYVQSLNGQRQRADALVFGSDGSPFEWPELTCGYGYIVTLDLPQSGTVPVVDMSLFSRAV